jgi:hypothetical protein
MTPFWFEKMLNFATKKKKRCYCEAKEGATKECDKVIKDFIAREMKRHIDCVTTAATLKQIGNTIRTFRKLINY